MLNSVLTLKIFVLVSVTKLTHVITMDDVSVVEICHCENTDEGEGKNQYFFVIRIPLATVQMRPNQVVDLKQYQK